MNKDSNKDIKTSKGYRLKLSTHKLVNKIQKELRTDADTVISVACKKLFKEIKNSSSILK